MTVEEIVDYINQDLTMSGSLPCILKLDEIRRLVVREALPWFYENYNYAVEAGYLYIPQSTLLSEQFTNYKYLELPEDVQNIIWIYMVENRSLFSLGIGLSGQQSNLSINQGVTNQPFLNSYLTTVGELGVYKVIIDGFGDMLNQLSKHTLKFDWNFASKRLQLLTRVQTDIIIEGYLRVPAEHIFEMDKFRRYVIALCKLQLGRLLTRFNFNLPGGVQMNGEAIRTEGQAELDKVKEEITKGNGNASFFIMNKR